MSPADFFLWFMRLFCVFLMLFCGLVIAQDSPDEDAINAQLSQIQSKLSQLKGRLNQATGEEANLLAELEKQDQAINALGQQIHAIKLQITSSEKSIADLTEQITIKNDSIAEQKSQMAELLRLNIYINHDRILKMLLLKSSTQTAEITQHQIKYLQQKLYGLIEDIAEQILQLQAIQKDLEAKQQGLAEQQDQLVAEQNKIQQQKDQRALVLTSLRQTIAQYRDENQQLEADQNRLNQLLSEITQLLNDLPEDLGSGPTFPRLKGQLPKPVTGKTIRSYRSLRAGYSRWDGIVIGQDPGKTIEAVAYGRVAFADWLRGYGLMLVIDHGDDYMTLYGHNESLLVEAGDWVQAGDAIATVGNSGNIDPNGLYFEIRRAADPTNPVPWFKK